MKESDARAFLAGLEASWRTSLPKSTKERYAAHLMRFDATMAMETLDFLESTERFCPSIAVIEEAFRIVWVRVQQRKPALPSGDGVTLAVALEEDPEVAEAWAHYQEVKQASAALVAGEEETG